MLSDVFGLSGQLMLEALVNGLGGEEQPSAFDICLDLHRNGAFPTMAQRSGVSVVPLEEGVRYNQDYLPGRLDMESADLKRASSAIYPLMIDGLQRVTVEYNQRLGRIFAGLRAKGLVIDDGPDNTGWLMKLFRWFKGFYINMGLSLIHI